MAASRIILGSLSIHPNFRRYAKKTLSGTMTKTVKPQKEKLEVYVLEEEYLRDARFWFRLCLYHMSHFYEADVPGTSHDRMTSMKLALSVLGLSCLMATPRTIKDNKDFKTAIAEAGMDISYTAITGNEICQLESHHFDALRDHLQGEAKWGELTVSMSGPLFMGVIMLTIALLHPICISESLVVL